MTTRSDTNGGASASSVVSANGYLARGAAELAARGYHVFPCRPRAKLPATSNGFKNATRDARQVELWWSENRAANIGIDCGGSGIAVLDVDSKHGADPREVMGELDLEDHPHVVWTGEAPEPDARHPKSLEGVRGVHLYFRGESPTVKTHIPGVEIRGTGSYVLGPPSGHPSGVPYEGELPPVDELLEIPGRLVQLLAKPSQNGSAPPIPAKLSVGTQHDTLVSFAGSMRRRGAVADEIYAALRVMNQRCEAPGSDEDMRRIAESMMSYEPAPPVEEEAPDEEQARIATLPLPDGGELLDEIETFIRRFVVFRSPAASRVLAAWVLHSHAFESSDSTPYMGIVSPVKRCGKSRLEEVLQLVARRAWKIDGAPSEATLFRKIEAEAPALLLDEADALWGGGDVRTEPLRAIFNSGNRRGATVPRCVGEGKNQEVLDFSVYCPKVLSGIKTSRWPDTVLDRCFLIPLRRRARGEQIERLRIRKVGPEAKAIYDRASRWAMAAAAALTEAEPELPDELDDRAQDGAEPLLAIAEQAGGEWPELIRDALLELHGAREVKDDSWGIQLLADIRQAFGADAERLSGQELRARLKADDEKPWAAWGKGDSGLTARGMATLLGDFNIESKQIWLGGKNLRGYERADFKDAWVRYLPENDDSSARCARTALASQEQAQLEVLGGSGSSTSESAENPHEQRDLADLADRTPKSGEKAESGLFDDIDPDPAAPAGAS
jgi:hypothetical protein